MRTTGCGEPRAQIAGETVRLAGWVARRRDHGGVIFLDLRDFSGLVQVVADPDSGAYETADTVRPEWVIEVEGVISKRPEGTENLDLATGGVEVRASRLEVLAKAETPPFVIDDRVEADEALRLKYRYLDLRRPKMAANIRLRAGVASAIRRSMEEQEFIEVETPGLTRSTPEGARDYLVPSRLQSGSFYALAQSPQLYKQLLMVAGIGRYYQIARCWRDENLRADRQPEFTQLDVEMSFAAPEDVMAVVEAAMCAAAEAAGALVPERPFETITWAEAMCRFGTDKPDLRLEGEIVDLTEGFGATGFKAFASVIESGGVIQGLVLRAQGAAASRSVLDALVEEAQGHGAKGLVWAVVQEGAESAEERLRSPVARFFSDGEVDGLIDGLCAEPGDLILIVADERRIAREVLGQMRTAHAALLRDDNIWCWVVDFPLVEWNEGEGRLDPLHHPFCAPHPDDAALLDEGAAAIVEAGTEGLRAQAFDLVLNGVELGSGSVRIHDPATQERVFDLIGIGHEEAESRFGFLLEAFRFGAPPHVGFAVGFDRLVALLAGADSIREVIAFPKTQTGQEPMTGAPTGVSRAQLDELGLRISHGKHTVQRIPPDTVA